MADKDGEGKHCGSWLYRDWQYCPECGAVINLPKVNPSEAFKEVRAGLKEAGIDTSKW